MLAVFPLLTIVFPIFASSPASCRQNEEFQSCGTVCEPSCYRPIVTWCKRICKFDVCQCLDGFYRHKNGQCVTLEECKPSVTKEQNHTVY